jgi:hypothetical protein
LADNFFESFGDILLTNSEQAPPKGTIPTQILNKTDKEKIAPIITSACLAKGGGRKREGGLAPLSAGYSPFDG